MPTKKVASLKFKIARKGNGGADKDGGDPVKAANQAANIAAAATQQMTIDPVGAGHARDWR